MHRPGHVFERGTGVLDYWSANCEGFTVARRIGSRRVASVVLDPRTGRATAMLIGSPTARHRRVVAAERVAAVDPFAQVVYLERGIRTSIRARERAQRLLVWLRPRARAFALAARATSAACARAAYRHGRDWLAWARPRVRAGALRAAVECRRLLQRVDAYGQSIARR